MTKAENNKKNICIQKMQTNTSKAFRCLHYRLGSVWVLGLKESPLFYRLHDRKTEHFKGITSACHASAIADHVTSTGHNLKWDHFEILAKGRSDTHCKIKETLLIQELKPILNDNVSSEKLYLY